MNQLRLHRRLRSCAMRSRRSARAQISSSAGGIGPEIVSDYHDRRIIVAEKDNALACLSVSFWSLRILRHGQIALLDRLHT